MRSRHFAVSLLAVSALLAPWKAAAVELTPEQIKAIVEQAKPYIEAEVQRRVEEELKKREAQKAAAPVETAAGAPPITPSKPWSPSQSIPLLKSGPSYLNLSLSADAVFGWSTESEVEVLEGAHHDPNQRGFSVTSAEVTLDGAVDPYFKGLATVTFVLEDESNETAVELEEAWLQTTSLPFGLQVKGGQFFAEFGRHNTLHSHSWAFVDQPIVVTRLMGPDGLRNPGAQVSWLAPTPFYLETMLGIFNGGGETAFSFRSEEGVDIHGGTPTGESLHGPGDLLFVPRLATSFDLCDTSTIVLGASAAFGPNDSGGHASTEIYGSDLYWKWRPENAEAGFPFVSLQSEFLYRRYEAATRILDGSAPPVTLPAETLGDWGFYAQLLYGFHRGWVAGMRGEWVNSDKSAFDSEFRGERTRLSPNLTFYPSEYSRLRLQYNYDHRPAFADDHTVWFAVEFLLGAHPAHKF